jgi:two-component system KDP operon response regulator KdpE
MRSMVEGALSRTDGTGLTMSAHRPRILVIDDEPQIHRFLGPALEAAGYEPVRADTAAQGLAAIAGRAPDAVILDLGLPDMDGKDALIRARAFYEGPILVLSARDMETEKIDALDQGADDYVEKPFHVGELLARLRVAMRHRLSQAGAAPIIHAGDVEIDLIKRLVTRAGEQVRLSPREYDLLARLAEGGGKVLTHRQLLTSVWGPANVDDVQYLRVFIGHLRQKLEIDPAAPRRIVTEAGVGYRFVGD